MIFGSVGALEKYIQEIDTIGKQVTNILVHINASEFFVFVFLIYFIWGLSVIAIHPLITLTLVLSSIDFQILGINPLIFGQVLLVGFGISLIATPFTEIALLVSNILLEDPWTISITWSKKYLIYYPLFMSFLFWSLNSLIL